MTFGFAFAGQGAFKPGFGKQYRTYPVFAGRLHEASEAAQLDLAELAWGRASVTTALDNSRLQITHFGLCWALAHTVAERCGPPALNLGHSLGELCALIYSGAIHLKEGAKLIRLRGELVERARKEAPQDMLIVFEGDHGKIAEFMKESFEGRVFVCNLNSHQQTAVSGKLADLQGFSSFLRDEHKIASKLLGTGIAFHSPLLSSAAVELNEAIDRLKIQNPSLGLFFSVEANKPLSEPEEIRRFLKSHLLGQVHWKRAINQAALHLQGEEQAVLCEIGPARVLKNLYQETLPDSPVPFKHCGELIQ